MKYILIFILSLSFINTYAQFTGTDSLRNYNNRYITTNPATAFTNNRLNTLLRGIIDFIDTARAGTGGGGALGIDTVFAVNDSTIRYRKNGVFRQFTLKGVYDSRRKVDTLYKSNDTTLSFTVNGSLRTIIIPGGTNVNLATANQGATGNRNHNWNDYWLYINNVKSFDINTDHPDPNHLNNTYKARMFTDSTADGDPLKLYWGLRNISDDLQDSVHFELGSTSTSTRIYHSALDSTKVVVIDLNAGVTTPNIQMSVKNVSKNSSFTFGQAAVLNPADSLAIKAIPAADVDSLLGARAISGSVNTVVKIPVSAMRTRFGLEDITGAQNRTFNSNGYNFKIDSFGQLNLYSKVRPSGIDRGLIGHLQIIDDAIVLRSYASNGIGTRTFGFDATASLTEMFAVGHNSGNSSYIQTDTTQALIESDPNRIEVRHDSVTIHNITGGALDLRLRTLPQTIDTTQWKPLAIGPLGQIKQVPGWPGGGGGASSGYGWINSSGVGKLDTATVDNRYLNVVNARRFGADPSLSDNTTALQSAINYVWEHGGGTIVIPGRLRVGGAVVDHGRGVKSQLYIPVSSSDSARIIRFVAENPSDMEVIGVAGMAVSKYGAIIESTLTGQADSTFILAALKGPGSGTYTAFNHTTFDIDGVCFRTNLDAGANGQGGLNLTWATKVLLNKVKIDITQPIFDMPDPTGSGSIGLLLPARGNHAAVEIGLLRIVGYDLGTTVEEHTVAQDLQLVACNVGAKFIGGDHSSSIQTLECELNKTNTVHDGDANIWISNFNSEHYIQSDKWFQFVSDVHFNTVSSWSKIAIGTYSASESGTGAHVTLPTSNHLELLNVLNIKFQSNPISTFLSTMLGEFDGIPGIGVLQLNNMSAVTDAKRFMMYNSSGHIQMQFANDAGNSFANVLDITQDALNPPSKIQWYTPQFNISTNPSFSGAKKFNVDGTAAINNGIMFNGVPNSGNDVNVMNLHASSSTMAFLAGTGTNTDASNGPFFNMRGNTYSAISGQRGVIFIGAGNPSTPTGLEGSILFYTANTSERMRINPTGNVLIATGTDNGSGAKLQVNGDATVADEAYDATAWNGSLEVPTKNAIRDKIESMSSGSSYTFSNGLTESAGAVKLGGALTQNTTIDGSSNYTTTFTGSKTFANSTFIAENTSSGRGISGITSTGVGVHGSSGSSGVGVLGLSSSGYGLWGQSTTGQGLYVQSPSTSGAANITANPSSTNTVHTSLTLARVSTSAGADGIGQAIDFNLNNTTAAGSVTTATRLISKLTTATSGAEVSQLEIWGVNTGLQARKFAIAGNGQITEDGYGANAFSVTPATTPVYSSTGVKGERVAPKIYTALLSQSGSSAPTATVLGTNEIGTIVWTRNSTGNYTGTLTGAFTANKTFIIVQHGGENGTGFINPWSFRNDANSININTLDNSNSATDGFTNMSIEIRVYP